MTRSGDVSPLLLLPDMTRREEGVEERGVMAACVCACVAKHVKNTMLETLTPKSFNFFRVSFKVRA